MGGESLASEETVLEYDLPGEQYYWHSKGFFGTESRKLKKINILSIDLEYWYSNEFLLDYLPDNPESQVIEATSSLLHILKKYDTHATFFVLGSVAEKHPDLVKLVYEEGHEISSHGYSHTTLTKLGKDKFEDELKRSTELLKSITGEQPLGFRAPSFSVNQSTSWIFDLLEKYGYTYDSSIFPIKSLLYGVPKAPLTPYRPNKRDIANNDPNGKIIEFPLSVLKFPFNIPTAGGFYFRAQPYWFTEFALNWITRDRPVIMYIHPWETYRGTPRLKVPPLARFEAYYGINSSLNKFEKVLKKYKFGTIRNALGV